MHLKFNNHVMGVALFNIDHTAQNEQRAFIRHISVTDIKYISKAVDQVVKFIWENVECQNIRVQLWHVKDQEKDSMSLDPNIKTAYYSIGFKWKTLTNDPATGKRAQIMQLNRPNRNQNAWF
mmetsp:Transcript_31809/g.31100  ORF Transcript_31809/g.31100 Transcript_31809/m.31100 type:complete len:122 (+) Transcript_31809:846-1211(+)